MKQIILLFILWMSASAIVYAQITINVGDNIQQKVDANPGNTTFLIKSGTHRLQTVKPKTGNIFIGENGAILNGSRLLTGWQQEGNFWVMTGQDQSGQVHGTCSGTSTMCQYPEDLFMDDAMMTQVEAKDSVKTGKWFFDYTNDKVYMLNDPSGHKMEISTSRAAFSNTNASDVTIKNIIVEKYAIPAQMGAIGDQYPGAAWLIEDCEFRWNHGVGVKINGKGIVRGCRSHHNGQMGVAATGTGGLFENNEIDSNLIAGFDSSWEGGGSKFDNTDSLTVRNNFVHHNHGPGLWTDINNHHTTYEGNLVEYNDEMGIFHEISFEAVIRCNTVRYNSVGWYPWLYGAQILISTSQDVEVYDNIVTVSASGGNGITAINQDRGSKWYCKNNLVHDNTITYLGATGISGVATDTDVNNFWATANNIFANNKYHVPDASVKRWRYKSTSYTWSSFQSQGQDTSGTVDTDLSYAGKKACEVIANVLPKVWFVSPTDNNVFDAGSTMDIIADASDSDGTILNIKLYLNDAFVRQESNPPYKWSPISNAALRDSIFKNMQPGIYKLKAVATDNSGDSSETTITIIISAPKDCAGITGGSAFLDSCGVCSGGTTGITPNLNCTVGISESNKINLSLYPNPAVNEIHVNGLSAGSTWIILDIHLMECKTGNQMNIDVSAFSSGLYFLKLSDGEVVKFNKL